VAFVDRRNEMLRLGLLLIAAILFELFILSRVTFSLLATSAEWALWLHFIVLLVPRLLAMVLLVASAGPFQRLPWFAAFLAAYGAVLLVSFNRVETFVNWDSSVAAMRATLPYIAGVCGAVFGFWIRRPLTKSAT
jgi:hypothetical protein